jgi:hypothetical protein
MHRYQRRALILAASLLSATGLASGLGAASASATSAAPANTAAPKAAAFPAHYAGVWVYDGKNQVWDWMGTDITTVNGKTYIVLCRTPGLPLKQPDSVIEVSRLSGLPGAKFREATYILGMADLSARPSPAADIRSASARAAILDLEGRMPAGIILPGNVASGATADIQAASVFAGPYKASLSDGTRANVPGQDGSVKLTVTSHAGHFVPRLFVSFSAKGASIGGSGRTSEWQKLTRTATGVMSVTGSARIPASVLYWSHPAGGQELIGSPAPVQVEARTAYMSVTRPFNARFECPQHCGGHPVVTATFCSAPGADRSAFTTYENGQAFGKVVTIGAVSAGAKNGKCANMSEQSIDGDVITAKVVYYGANGRRIGSATLTGSFTVICRYCPAGRSRSTAPAPGRRPLPSPSRPLPTRWPTVTCSKTGRSRSASSAPGLTRSR